MPVKSLTNSSQLIADYIAGKIEQSYPIQPLFQEILLMFQQEAICIGPGFQNDNSSGRTSSKGGESAGSDRKAAGPGGNKNSTSSNRKPDSFISKGAKLNEKGKRSISEDDNNHLNLPKGSGSLQLPLQDTNQPDMPIVEGFRIVCSGRLQMSPRSKPAEKAESVVISRGVLPFNTFDQNIDFKQTYATNAYGTVGIKV